MISNINNIINIVIIIKIRWIIVLQIYKYRSSSFQISSTIVISFVLSSSNINDLENTLSFPRSLIYLHHCLLMLIFIIHNAICDVHEQYFLQQSTMGNWVLPLFCLFKISFSVFVIETASILAINRYIKLINWWNILVDLVSHHALFCAHCLLRLAKPDPSNPTNHPPYHLEVDKKIDKLNRMI